MTNDYYDKSWLLWVSTIGSSCSISNMTDSSSNSKTSNSEWIVGTSLASVWDDIWQAEPIAPAHQDAGPEPRRSGGLYTIQ